MKVSPRPMLRAQVSARQDPVVRDRADRAPDQAARTATTTIVETWLPVRVAAAEPETEIRAMAVAMATAVVTVAGMAEDMVEDMGMAMVPDMATVTGTDVGTATASGTGASEQA